VLPGVIGVLQATEVIKLILGQGEPLIGRLMTFDALESSFRVLKIGRDPECPACSDHATLDASQVQDMDYQISCALPIAGD
jgi:sulfur-carrier protein adenylyltransferase/sulfurtransferase